MSDTPLPLGERTAIVTLVRERLHPIVEPPAPLAGTARNRAELHAAIVHQPERRQAGPSLSM